jgi:hypothetical protein
MRTDAGHAAHVPGFTHVRAHAKNRLANSRAQKRRVFPKGVSAANSRQAFHTNA